MINPTTWIDLARFHTDTAERQGWLKGRKVTANVWQGWLYDRPIHAPNTSSSMASIISNHISSSRSNYER